MSYEDRDLRGRVRALIDGRPVPDRPLRPARPKSSLGPLLLAAALVAIVAVVVGATLQMRAPVASPEVTLTATSTASAVTTPVAAERLEVPPDVAGRSAMVSPDARFVGAVARDRSRAILYRIDRANPPTAISQLVQVGEVRGRIAELSWLDDSSALLVEVAAPSAIPTGGPRPTQTNSRVVFLETSGRMVQSPDGVSSFRVRRANLSPDGEWFPVYGGSTGCCGSYVRLLSRNGVDVKNVVPPPSDGSAVYFVGWDKAGLLLYVQSSSDRSVLNAIDLTGKIHYSVPTPPELGGAGWGIFAAPADRSWAVIEFGRGVGSVTQGYRVLVDGELRPVPAEVEAGWLYGLSPLENELVYRGADGSMRAWNVRTGASRTFALKVSSATPGGLSTVGLVDRFFVWMDMIHGFVGNLDNGVSVELPLQSPPNVERLEGANLAEYRDDRIAIFNLAAWMRAPR